MQHQLEQSSLCKIDVDVQTHTQIQHQLNCYDREGNRNATIPRKPEEKHENSGQRVHLGRHG